MNAFLLLLSSLAVASGVKRGAFEASPAFDSVISLPVGSFTSLTQKFEIVKERLTRPGGLKTCPELQELVDALADVLGMGRGCASINCR